MAHDVWQAPYLAQWTRWIATGHRPTQCRRGHPITLATWRPQAGTSWRCATCQSEWWRRRHPRTTQPVVADVSARMSAISRAGWARKRAAGEPWHTSEAMRRRAYAHLQSAGQNSRFAVKSYCVRNHPLGGPWARVSRRQRPDGRWVRACVACKAARHRAYTQARRAQRQQAAAVAEARARMVAAHPDHGGTAAAFRVARAAYVALRQGAA